jgi:hypothetical protein
MVEYMKIPIEYAEATIGINDSTFDETEDHMQLIVDFIKQRCRSDIMTLAFEITPVYFKRGINNNNNNTKCRGIKITIRFCECNLYDANMSKESCYQHWKDEVTKLIKSTITFLGQDNIYLYFVGGNHDHVEVLGNE